MKVTIEGSPNELKSFFNSSVDTEKLWKLVNKKDQGHIDLDLFKNQSLMLRNFLSMNATS